MRTDRLRAEYQIEFRYTLFPLHPETPDEGMSLEELFAGRSFDIDAMQARLKSPATDSTEWETADLMFALTFLGFKRSEPNE